MTNTGIIGIILIIANIVFSYKGLADGLFFDRYKFEVDKILINKEYRRLITSGFLHVGWTHLIFNVVSLYIFSGLIERSLGGPGFIIIYFTSLVGGNLLSLLVYRNQGDYSSVGASGAICGVMFASIALFPGFTIGLFFLPISIPGWIFGLLFVLFSIYGIKSKRDNIGHEAHLGGALIGMAVSLAMRPSALIENYLTILIIAVPSLGFIYLIATRPQFLLIDNFFFTTHKDSYTIDQKYNLEKNKMQEEIDRILDKINKKGMNSLSKEEKERLKKYSRAVR
jgi:membrane associated rhomboid family serine protease